MPLAELLAITLNALSIPVAGVKVLDCCARDAQLAFDLLPHFGAVSSNDLDQKARVQTHYDVRRPEFWQSVHGVYDYLITKPPTALIESILHNALEHFSLVALCIPSEKQTQLSNLLTHKSPSITIAVGSSHHWLIWVPSLSYRNLFIEINDNDLSLRGRLSQDDFVAHIKERITFAVSRSLPPHQMPAAAAAAAAAGSFVPGASPFYSQSQFQSPYHSMGFGYPGDPSFGGSQSMDAYHFGSASPYVGKRDPSIGYEQQPQQQQSSTAKRAGTESGQNSQTSTTSTGAAAASTASNGATNNPAATPGFMEFSTLAGQYPRHPSAAAYAQPILPYYARTPGQPPSPNTQAWHFQQSPWGGGGFSAAQLAGALGPNPNGPGAYHPGAPQFNPAAILMDMDKFTQQNGAAGGASPAAAAAAGTLGMSALGASGASVGFNSRSLTDSTTTSAGSSPSGPAIGYGLHKPTAFKAGANVNSPPTSTSPGPEDQQLMLSQAEMLYLKGVHAAKQGKALEVAIDKYRSVYSKKDVITKVCKMKYRSAQRKLRIAKHIQRFPEISTMTQRQAERYISEKLRKSRGHEGRSASSEED
jgi:hypothetical protein